MQIRSYAHHSQSDSIWYPQSEACLTLNVIRGASVKENSKLPVGVWIHGGGFYMGSGADQRYNMSAMVENSYRIGTFSHDSCSLFLLSDTSQGNHSSPSRSTTDFQLGVSSAPAKSLAVETPIWDCGTRD